MNLGNLADIQMGYPFRSRVEHDPQGDVAVVQMKDIDDGSSLNIEEATWVTLREGKPHHFLRPGDVLFRSRGVSYGATLVPDRIDAAVLAAPMLLIRPYAILPAYLCWYINTPSARAKITALAEGTSVRMVSKAALAALDIPVPDSFTQQEIVEVDQLARREYELSTQISELRKKLIDRLLVEQARNLS